MDEHERRFRHERPEDIAEIFETMSAKIPGLIKGVLDSLFSPEAAANMGKSVAEFYKSLKEGGVPEQDAIAMTRDYLSTLTRWSEGLKGARGHKWGSEEKE